MAQAGKGVSQERKNEIGRAFYWRHHKASLERARKQREVLGYKECTRAKLLGKKAFVLTHYGNGYCACVRCGFDNVKALSIDHIKGRTPNEPSGRKLNGMGIYYWLIREGFPNGFQTLCMNCQFIKREDNHEFSNQYTASGKKRL